MTATSVIEQTLFSNSCLLRVGLTPSTSKFPSTSVSPKTELKKVDLPAPLGPIRPITCPRLTSRSRPDKASKPSKLFLTDSALITTSFIIFLCLLIQVSLS